MMDFLAMNQLDPRRVRPVAQGMNIKEFLAFYRSRPDEEHWELIDGVAIMMATPTLAHNRIADNPRAILNAHFRAGGLDLYAYGDTSVRTKSVSNYLPRPDVMVGPRFAGHERSSEKYELVAEVLYPSNRKRLVAQKLKYYQAHPGNACVLIVDSRRIWLEKYERAAGWSPYSYSDPDDTISLEAFGVKFKLADLYVDTPLDPSRR